MHHAILTSLQSFCCSFRHSYGLSAVVGKAELWPQTWGAHRAACGCGAASELCFVDAGGRELPRFIGIAYHKLFNFISVIHLQ